MAWFIEGSLPDVDTCDISAPLYLRVRGELLPSPGGGSPLLVASEIVEGPCWKHSCDEGGDPCDCGTFEDVCNMGPGFGGIGCNLFRQNCYDDSEKCMPWANDGGGQWNSTRCSPVADNPGQPGDPCTVEGNALSGIDDCDIGMMCWDVDPATNAGTCVSMCNSNQCNPDPSCEDPSTTCAIAYDGNIALCLPTCDPLMPDCSPEQGCYETANGSFCLPDAP